MVKILVIEDDAHILGEVKDWLIFNDYEVVTAENGRIGLELAEKLMPDMIISDIAMPEMTGHEVLLEIRSNPQLSAIPFVFITASADRSSVRHGMDMGADDYITKPFTYDELIGAVKSRLAKIEQIEERVDKKVQHLENALETEREQRLLKSRLVAMFSHDFRNPIAVIVSSANLIIEYEDRLSSENKAKKMKRIVSASYKLNEMLDEMLMVAEMESEVYEVTIVESDIVEAVKDILSDFRIIYEETHNILFTTSFYGVVPLDLKLLRQILSNLISNAAKYSANGSTIDVLISKRDDHIDLSVRDFGIGIPEPDLPNLFEPFHRATNVDGRKGTGLGLSIVKQAAELCSAKIEVRSQVNGGTTFTVSFPQNVTQLRQYTAEEL